MVGVRRSADGIERPRRHPRGAAAKRPQAVGEQQRVLDVRGLRDRGQVGRAVARLAAQVVDQCGRVAAPDGEVARCVGHVAEDDRPHGDVAQAREMRGQQAQVAHAVCALAAQARIPQHGDQRGRLHGTRRGSRDVGDVIDSEIRFAAGVGLDDHRVARDAREGDDEVVWTDVAARGLGDVAILPLRERKVCRARSHHRPQVGAHHLDAQRERLERDVEAQRQLVGHIEAVGCGVFREFRDVLDGDRATATGRQGPDARPEGVSPHPLDQAGIDALPHLGIEGDARLLRLDDHAVDHASADIERKARDHRRVGEGVDELAFEHAAGVVAEGEGRPRTRGEARDRHLVARRFEHERRRGLIALAAEHDRAARRCAHGRVHGLCVRGEARRRRAVSRGTGFVGGPGPSAACHGDEAGDAGEEHGEHSDRQASGHGAAPGHARRTSSTHRGAGAPLWADGEMASWRALDV